MLITRVIPVLSIHFNIPDVIWNVTVRSHLLSYRLLSYLEQRGALWWISASCWWGWSRRRALRRRCRRSGFWCCTPWQLCFPAGWRGDLKTTSHCPRTGWWCDWAMPLVTLCCRHCTWKEKIVKKIRKGSASIYADLHFNTVLIHIPLENKMKWKNNQKNVALLW